LNIKFSPTSLESGSSLEKFVQLLKTYLVDLEGSEVQVNVFSAEMLREARQNPEKFQDLIIRVAIVHVLLS
jgi:formate C-acetyltransferase